MAKKKIVKPGKDKTNKTKKKRMTTQERKEKYNWEMEMYEREARQRTAWAGFVQTMSYIRANEEEKEYQQAKYYRDDKKIKEIDEKRKNQRNTLIIC